MAPSKSRCGSNTWPDVAECGWPTRYYDREGKPIDLWRWAELQGERDYIVVIQENLTPDVRVSTVWLGLDHRFGPGRPLIFETMVFGGPRDEEQHRYASEAEARLGHAGVLEAVALDLFLARQVRES
jgi:hypothetical protein